MKKVRTGLALLVVLGFISTLVGGVGHVFGNPGGVTDYFDDVNNPEGDPEYYIDSTTNLVVSGGQVMLEEIVQVCYSGGNPQTTDWGSGLYGCTGEDARCYSGSCITCGGWMNAGYCWYDGAVSQSCTTVCAGRGGVYNGTCDWVNDPSNCSTPIHFHGGSCYGSSGQGPYTSTVQGANIYHQDGTSDCGWSHTRAMRQCACNR